jgi:hypothetical protein
MAAALCSGSRQLASLQMYVPRPGRRPVSSTSTAPMVVRTIRVISRFGRELLQTAQVRVGM